MYKYYYEEFLTTDFLRKGDLEDRGHFWLHLPLPKPDSEASK